jgi:hypothetical protein
MNSISLEKSPLTSSAHSNHEATASSCNTFFACENEKVFRLLDTVFFITYTFFKISLDFRFRIYIKDSADILAS